MTDRAVDPKGERRVAVEKRLRVAQMSPEEMRRELLTSVRAHNWSGLLSKARLRTPRQI